MGLFIKMIIGIKMTAIALYYYEREERMNTQGVSIGFRCSNNIRAKKSSDTSYRS